MRVVSYDPMTMHSTTDIRLILRVRITRVEVKSSPEELHHAAISTLFHQTNGYKSAHQRVDLSHMTSGLFSSMLGLGSEIYFKILITRLLTNLQLVKLRNSQHVEQSTCQSVLWKIWNKHSL